MRSGGPAEQRRWLIYHPAIDTNSFVFFYFKGTTGRSWSVRHYAGGPPRKRYAKEFAWTDAEVLRMAEHKVPVEEHHTEDIAWYETRIRELNRKHLSDRGVEPSFVPTPAVTPKFPFLDYLELMKLPKARKRGDLDRMLNSAQSEDYVTWNMFRGLMRREDWWPRFLKIAPVAGANLLPSEDQPVVEFWRRVLSPLGYERGSRQRMLTSELAQWQARAGQPEPVEGTTEVDVSLEGASYLVFIETKLGSDVSWRTTYDPTRNQIARNIDCLIETSGSKMPHFWMIVRDKGPGRTYTQLMESYSIDPSELVGLLPHRNPELVTEISRRSAILLWNDLLISLPDTDDIAQVRGELKHRIHPSI